MLTQDDIKQLAQVLATKEDVAGLRVELKSLDNKVGGLEDKVGGLGNAIVRLNKKMDRHYRDLKEDIKGVIKYAENIEDERDKNEKRLKRVEKVLNLSPL